MTDRFRTLHVQTLEKESTYGSEAHTETRLHADRLWFMESLLAVVSGGRKLLKVNPFPVLHEGTSQLRRMLRTTCVAPLRAPGTNT